MKNNKLKRAAGLLPRKDYNLKEHGYRKLRSMPIRVRNGGIWDDLIDYRKTFTVEDYKEIVGTHSRECERLNLTTSTDPIMGKKCVGIIDIYGFDIDIYEYIWE